MGSSRKKPSMGGGGYIIFSVIYPLTFQFFTSWTSIKLTTLDTKIYPWTLQIHPMDMTVFQGFFNTPGQYIFYPQWMVFFWKSPILKKNFGNNLLWWMVKVFKLGKNFGEWTVNKLDFPLILSNYEFKGLFCKNTHKRLILTSRELIL